ncbi:MAG: hypothetical protein ACYSR6_02965 [Planctomycetota bacterium]|jgi:hypothetical protein
MHKTCYDNPPDRHFGLVAIRRTSYGEESPWWRRQIEWWWEKPGSRKVISAVCNPVISTVCNPVIAGERWEPGEIFGLHTGKQVATCINKFEVGEAKRPEDGGWVEQSPVRQQDVQPSNEQDTESSI